MDRLRLALQRMLSGIGEPDRAARQSLGHPVGQHSPRLGRRLHPRGGIHCITGYHPLTDSPQRDGHLAGHHPGPGCKSRHSRLASQFGHRSDQIQRSTHRPLRIPFGRQRRAPDRHPRIADELLPHPAVPDNHRPRHLEIAGQQLPHRLRIPRLRQRGEPDQVAEQHRAHPPLRGPLTARPGRRRRHG